MKTKQDWYALKDTLSLSGQAFINGERTSAQSGKTFPVVNPASETVLVEAAECDQADVDLAVAAAKRAFEEGSWSQAAPSHRKTVLLRLTALIAEHRDEFALIDSLDMGKPIAEMVGIDMSESLACWQWTAESIDKIYGEISPTHGDTLGLITHEPVGVVGAITPWNYPFMMMTWKIAPALAAGNSVVLKPSERAPLSAIRLAELALEAGLPKGVFNVVPGYGHTAGKALALHDDVRVLTFTGSTRVAGQLMQYAGQSNLKRVLTEAGGKSPMLVFDDCADLDAAAQRAAFSIFMNQGEMCIACSRLYVHDSIKEAFLEKLIALAKGYQPGDPLDPDTKMGAAVDRAHFEAVNASVAGAEQEGLHCIYGGTTQHKAGEGYYFSATIFDDVPAEASVMRKEIFGPVLAVCGFKDEAEVIALANDTPYGLGASVWTSDLNRAHRLARKLESGMVWVNGWGGGDPTLPFGGIKASGNGRDRSLHSVLEYTNMKSIWMSLEP